MVCQAWLDRDDIEAVLAAQSAFPLVRGIRHKPRAVASPDKVSDDLPGSMMDPKWRRGFALLRPHGLSFDLQTPWWHFAQALDLAGAFPETQIIVNHTGLPSDRGEEALAGWRAALRTLAQAPNVAIKISGIGQPGRPWTVEANRRVVLDTIETFGVERCMFASNFPVDGLVASFRTIFDGFIEITRDLAADERRKLFHDNAVRFYRLTL
jgi:predicted TIM-barrel fold metal-dependent hydrolase